MKPYNYLLLPLLLCTLWASCSKEDQEYKDDKDNEDKELNTPVGLIPHVMGISLTRAAGDLTDAAMPSAIGIYAVNQDKTQSAYGIWPTGSYGKYTKNETDNNFVPATGGADQTIWLTSDVAVIYSCHPAPDDKSSITDGNPSGTSFDSPIPCLTIPAEAINLTPTIVADATSFDFAQPANDYMYGVEYSATTGSSESDHYLSTYPLADNGHATAGNTPPHGPNVSIGLKHAFAQTKLQIKKGDYLIDPTISQVAYTRSMKVLSSSGNSKMQLTDGALTGLTETAAYTYTYNLSSLTPDGGYLLKSEPDTPNVLIITNYALPNEAATKSVITVTVDGKDMSITLDSDPAWAAGTIYSYTLSINNTGLELTGVSIVGWKDADENNTTETL